MYRYAMDKELKTGFQERPLWILATIIILLIQASPAFTDLLLDFFPNWTYDKRWISLCFIVGGFFLFCLIYWFLGTISLKSRNPNKIKEDDEYFIKKPRWFSNFKYDLSKMSEKEKDEYFIKKAQWLTWRQNISNVIKFGIVPPFFCWVISWFINKKYNSYYFDPFYFPRYWKKYNYEETISNFFKSMFRVYIGEEINKSYEIKFAKDFRHIEIRWIDKDTETKFSDPKKELYEKVFSENRFKHIKIFTWIFPFGLWWNLINRLIRFIYLLIRSIKNLFKKEETT